jgi:hypothetical protein
MDPTNLPTDSLYKFMALSGLAILGFCVWLFSTNTDRLLEQSASADAALAKLKAERTADDIVRQFTGRLDKLGDDARRRQLESLSERPSKEGVDQAEAVLAAGVEQVRKEILETAEKQKARDALYADWDSKSKAFLTGANLGQKLNSVLLWTAALGALASALGFAMWWYKVQQMHDIILKRQALGEIPPEAST